MRHQAGPAVAHSWPVLPVSSHHPLGEEEQHWQPGTLQRGTLHGRIALHYDRTNDETCLPGGKNGG